MKYDKFQKIRKRQKEAFATKAADPSAPYADSYELKEKKAMMKDPIAKHLSSASPKSYMMPTREYMLAKHFPGSSPETSKGLSSRDGVDGRWEVQDGRPRVRIPKEDVDAKYLSSGSPVVAKSSPRTSSTKRGDSNRQLFVASPPRQPSLGSPRRKMQFRYEEVDEVREDEGPTDLVEAVRNKPCQTNFLPVARPYTRPDPPLRDDEIREGALQMIDVIPSAKTDVSDMTGLTFGTGYKGALQKEHRETHFTFQEEDSPKTTVDVRKHLVSIDLTCLEADGVEVAAEFTKPHDSQTERTEVESGTSECKGSRCQLTPKVEQRFGLPYESTDFRFDDDGCTVDSWEKAIVNQPIDTSVLEQPSSPHAPIDVEKLFLEHGMGSSTPATWNENQVRDEDGSNHRTPTSMNTPTNRNFSSPEHRQIKETLSADGDVIVDVSEVTDNARESHSRKSSPVRLAHLHSLFFCNSSNDKMNVASPRYWSTSGQQSLRDTVSGEGYEVVGLSQGNSPRFWNSMHDSQQARYQVGSRQGPNIASPTAPSHSSTPNKFPNTEAVSAAGDVIVDISHDRKSHMKTARMSPQQALKPNQLAKAILKVPTHQAQASPHDQKKEESNMQGERSPRSLATSPPPASTPFHEDKNNASMPRGGNCQPTVPKFRNCGPSPLQISALKAQIPTISTPTSPVDDIFSFSAKYIKTFTDSVGSHLQKIDHQLLPEDEIKNLLGVLDQDLQAASKQVPQGQEMVDYLGKQLEATKCSTNHTVACTSPQNLNVTSASIDEVMDSMRKTYQSNLANCGTQALERNELPMPAPQTFIVPISLRGRDVTAEEVFPRD